MFSWHDFLGANEKPKDVAFKTFPKSVTVHEKESVQVECEISGNPTDGKRLETIYFHRWRAVTLGVTRKNYVKFRLKLPAKFQKKSTLHICPRVNY